MNPKWILLNVVVAAFGVRTASAAATVDLYVDPELPVAQTTSYNPGPRTATGGAHAAYKNLTAAADVAVAGQIVILRGGIYREALAPKNSGMPGRRLVFRGQQGESALITGEKLAPAIVLNGRDYVSIENLKIARVQRWLMACKAHHCVLQGNTFSQALDSGGSSKTGLFFEEATHNRIVDNLIVNSTQDHLALVKSDRNLVEGNIFAAKLLPQSAPEDRRSV